MSAYLTPLEVADLLNIGKSTVYRAIQKGELVAYKIGGYRIKPEDIDRWVRMRRVRPTPHNGLATPRTKRPRIEPVIDFDLLINEKEGEHV